VARRNDPRLLTQLEEAADVSQQIETVKYFRVKRVNLVVGLLNSFARPYSDLKLA
jgi:hypothetical protein